LPSHLSARGRASRSDGIDSNGGLAPGRIARANVRGAPVGRHLARPAKVVIGCSARAGGATTALSGHLQSVEFDRRFIGRRLGAFMEGSWKREDKCPYCRVLSRSRRSNSGLIAYHLFLPAQIVGWLRSAERRSVTSFGSSSAMSHWLSGPSSSPRKGGARNSRLLDRHPGARAADNRVKFPLMT
jgi:hypothetical protein